MEAIEPILEAVGLCAGYGNVPVLREVNLVVRPGEVVALLGANGAGKSTTLKALAGFLKPRGGKVILSGSPAPAALFKRSRAGIAYISEERGIFRGLNTIDNLRLGRGQPEVAYELMPELRPLAKRK